MKNEFQTKEIVVVGTGERVILYSCDGWRWYSDKQEAEECEKRREKLFQENKRSMKRTPTFAGHSKL